MKPLNTSILNNHGTPVAGITSDIEGNTRDASTPDIGAYEFTAPPSTITISGNLGIAGAVLSWDDSGPESTTADGSGNYSLVLPYGWSGSVIPSLTGYTFEPLNREYTNISADQSNQDFTPMPLPSNLAAYWPLNESVSGSYVDLTGTNNGTGTTTPATGQVNGAQQFNGTTDKIEVPADPAFDFAATDNFSVEFWYKGVLSPLMVLL